MNCYKNCKICNKETQLINQLHNLVHCNNCEIIFCNEIFTQDQLVKVYDDLYNKNASHYLRHAETEYLKLKNKEKIKIGLNRSKLIKNTVKNNVSVLEFGSGVGLVAIYLKNNFENINYSGIEIDEMSYQKSKLLGLNTFNGDFSYANQLSETFDVIMLWEVLEHFQDLNEFLKIAFNKLNKNGRIILSTPNYNKIYNYPNRTKDNIYQDLPPIHLNFFTPKNIKNIFELHGFTNIKVRTKKYPYFNPKSFTYYIDIVKAIFNKHNGTTIYLEAQK